jgi:hypothetical protein
MPAAVGAPGWPVAVRVCRRQTDLALWAAGNMKAGGILDYFPEIPPVPYGTAAAIRSLPSVDLSSARPRKVNTDAGGPKAINPLRWRWTRRNCGWTEFQPLPPQATKPLPACRRRARGATGRPGALTAAGHDDIRVGPSGRHKERNRTK